MSIMRLDPFRELVSMRDTFNRFFEEALTRPRTEFPTMFGEVPALDIYETEETIKVEMPLPGMQAEEIEVTLAGNLLTIKGKHQAKEEVKQDRYYRREIRYSTFERKVSLPENADVEYPTTEFEAGVLTVAFPKLAKTETKKLEVKEREPVAVA